MSFSLRIPVNEDGTVGMPVLSGDLPMRHLRNPHAPERHFVVHGHDDEDVTSLSVAMGGLFVSAQVPHPKQSAPPVVELDESADQVEERAANHD